MGRTFELTNTLTGKKTRIFKKKENIIYTCGPTVYNDAHIGNIRPSVIASLISSIMKELWNGKVSNYQNITDIDDKIILEAKKVGKNPNNLANEFIDKFLEIIKCLELDEFTWEKVTTNLKKIEDYIEKLYKKGLLLEDNNSLSIDVVGNREHYGKLVPVKNINTKSNFAVWKKINKEEYGYESIHGKGRPGWHTECSAIIYGIVGKGQVDIHISGRDIKFPHNENERFQHKLLTNNDISKCWVHVGNVTLASEKMSKSLGNVILAKNVLKEYTHCEVKLWLMTTKYSNDIVYSNEALLTARNTLDMWKRTILNSLLVLGVGETHFKLTADDTCVYKDVMNHLLNDLATPQLIAFLNKKSQLLKDMIKKYYTTKIPHKEWKKELTLFAGSIKFLLGININDFNIQRKEINLFNNWRNLIEKKEWKKADSQREILKEKKLLI